MSCPYCQKVPSIVVKFGFYCRLRGNRRRIQKYRCRRCSRYFSEQCRSLSYRQHKPELDQIIFALLNSSMSQRRCAKVLQINRKTVARKLVRLGRIAEQQLRHEQSVAVEVGCVMFDEMETFEHTKCKPLSIAVAVEECSRRLLSVKVSKMPAKGPLAAISRKKYGFRPDERGQGLKDMLAQIHSFSSHIPTFKTDKCPRYPQLIKKCFPNSAHVTFKGRRASVVGLGELKVGGIDPLFSINHTEAMIRDNIKRLARKTWCTTKVPVTLQALLNMYCIFHNGMIDHKGHLPEIVGPPNFVRNLGDQF